MARFFCNNSHTSKIVSIILCFLFLVSEGRAQTQNLNTEKWVFKLGFALNRSFVIDKNFSLINYNGNGPGFNSTINFKSKNVEQELSFSYSSYQLKNKYQNKLDESYINGNYTSLFCLTNREKKGFKLLAGPNLSVMHNTRKYEGFLNNNNTFDFASSLGASIEFDCGINKLMKGITLKNRFPQYEIDSFISNHTLTKRFKKTFKCSIINNQIKINKATFNSYNAAIIADFYRIILLVSKINFSYESVFSDASKINSVKQLKKNDHQIYSYIVSTLNPEINKSRVKHRVANAGHSVPENKIEERYYKSLINIKKVIPFSHRAFIIDNSQQYEPVLITEVFEGKTIKYLNQHYQPNWLKNLIKL